MAIRGDALSVKACSTQDVLREANDWDALGILSECAEDALEMRSGYAEVTLRIR